MLFKHEYNKNYDNETESYTNNNKSASLEMTDLLFDWNKIAKGAPPGLLGQAFVFDETLRDGLQSPSVIEPSIEQKLSLINQMDALGIVACDLGMPGASTRQQEDIKRMLKHIRDNNLKICPVIACRAVISEIAWTVKVSQEMDIPLEIYIVIASSPIRQFVENWSLTFIENQSKDVIEYAVNNGLKCTYVSEDSTRATPEQLRRLFVTAIEAGASRLCLCDTVGDATPDGAESLTKFTLNLINELGRSVEVDWHGHNDRGLALANALAAGTAGATRLHGCAAGIGERCGNTSTDQLLINLKLSNHPFYGNRSLKDLSNYVQNATLACGYVLPINYPVIGRDAFRTSSGMHAAAIMKANVKGGRWLADRVYSSVSAEDVGREQIIEVGPMSGLSNVNYWLNKHGLPKEFAESLLKRVKQYTKVLEDSEIYKLIDELRDEI